MGNSVSTRIDRDLCTGCALCLEVCPSATISMEEGRARVAGSRCIACGHCEAVCPAGAVAVGELSEPFSLQTVSVSEEWLAPGKFDPAALVQLMRSRRSCRNYLSRPVHRAVLEDLVRIGSTAPSGTNSQKWTFTIISPRRQVEGLGILIAGFFKKLNRMAENPLYRLYSRLFGGNALGNYYACYYTSVRENLKAWEEKGEDHLFHGAAALIVVGSLPGASCPAEDALLASQNILLAAHAMGLGSCLIGYAVEAMNHDPRIREQAGIPGSEPVHAVIALGYPKETYTKPAGRKMVLIRWPEIPA